MALSIGGRATGAMVIVAFAVIIASGGIAFFIS
jgi:hypothetical protein